MMKKLDHVSILVRDIDKALALFTTVFGLRGWRHGVVEIPEEGIKSVIIPVGKGNLESIELLEPTDPESHYAKHLQAHGEGLYHISLLVDDIEAEVKSLRDKGVKVGDAYVLPPSFPVEAKIAWIDPESAFGATIELVEFLPKE
jgi:methylmalonyl-CoA epimerase